MKIENTENNPQPQWLGGANPKAIEAQEAQGQAELTRSKVSDIVQQLPAKINSVPPILNGIAWQTPEGVRAIYQSMGIKLVAQDRTDTLFLDCKLPKGWEIRKTDHPMWSKLVDEKGIEMASIFYKAAFYDREAFINIK